MRIQIISLTKNDYKERKIGRWYFIPENIAKSGNQLKYDLAKDKFNWYLHYLSFKPDIIITYGLISGIVGLFKKLGLINKPVVMDWNDFYTEISGKSRGIAKTAFLEYLGVSNATVITTPSKYLVSLSRNLGKECFFINHGVSDEMDSKEKIPLVKGITLLYVGEQSKHKRVDELISSVSGLKCTLYLIGDVNPQFKKNASENVVFLGKLPQSEVVKYINSVDICLDTQDQDSSLKASEYAYKGKAIIAPNGRKSYLFTHLKNIYLTDDYREAVEYLIRYPKEITRLGINAKRLGIKKWRVVTQDYLKILSKIAKT